MALHMALHMALTAHGTTHGSNCTKGLSVCMLMPALIRIFFKVILIVFAGFVGLNCGRCRAGCGFIIIMKAYNTMSGKPVIRYLFIDRLLHWLFAVCILVLLFTGILPK